MVERWRDERETKRGSEWFCILIIFTYFFIVFLHNFHNSSYFLSPYFLHVFSIFLSIFNTSPYIYIYIYRGEQFGIFQSPTTYVWEGGTRGFQIVTQCLRHFPEYDIINERDEGGEGVYSQISNLPNTKNVYHDLRDSAWKFWKTLWKKYYEMFKNKSRQNVKTVWPKRKSHYIGLTTNLRK